MVKIVAVGHRGTAIGVPENSIISHETAYGFGARGIEFDIRPTKDKEFVIFHDSTLDRMTNGTGKLSDMTLAEIKTLRLTHEGKVTEHQIPTLRDALNNVRGRFMVDIDFKGGFENAEDVLKSVLRSEGFEEAGAPLVTIFCRDRYTCENLMDLNRIYSVRPVYENKHATQHMAELGIKAMGLRNHKFTAKRAARIRALNMALFTNTMTYNPMGLLREILGRAPKPRRKPRPEKLLRYYREAMHAESQFIQTDYLPDLVAYLKEHGAYEDGVLDRNYQPIRRDHATPLTA